VKLTGNTVLITGGSSGIGFELASQLIKLENKVIVTGRNQELLAATGQSLPGVHTIQSDVSDPMAIAELYRQVTADFDDLNVLINNAGVMRNIDLQNCGSDLVDITREIDINLSGSIRMITQFLPHLKNQPSAAIVNVSSGLAFVPFTISPVYSATKAALHSFTQTLRIQLKNTNVKVFELAPPGTDTALFTGVFAGNENSTIKPMDVKVLVKHALSGIERDRFEIRPGVSNALKLMSRIAPEFMLKQLSK
jgi:uncharacterized oxidoreductase